MTLFQHPNANRTLHIQGIQIDFLFERARRRTIGFLVGAEGLEVRAPRWVSLSEVNAALLEKSGWILKKLQQSRELQQRQDESQLVWKDGMVLPYLGADLKLQLDAQAFMPGAASGKASMQKSGADLLLCLNPKYAVSTEKMQEAAHSWFMQQALIHFENRLNFFAPLLGVRWTKFALSNAKTRWGSANSDGTIRLNWRLMHFEQSIIDYVVVHELSHLKVMNHSPRFWATVATLVPEYRQLRTRLKASVVPRW